MADVTAIQADVVERARLFIDEGASEDPRSLVEGLLMLLDLHDPPSAPVPAVTRDEIHRAVTEALWQAAGDDAAADEVTSAVWMLIPTEAPQPPDVPDVSPVPAVTRVQVHPASLADIHDRLDEIEEVLSAIAEAVDYLPDRLAPRPKVLCRGKVVYAAGGHVDVVVDRDTDAYPPVTARVAVVALGPPVPEAPEGGSDAG